MEPLGAGDWFASIWCTSLGAVLLYYVVATRSYVAVLPTAQPKIVRIRLVVVAIPANRAPLMAEAGESKGAEARTFEQRQRHHAATMLTGW